MGPWPAPYVVCGMIIRAGKFGFERAASKTTLNRFHKEPGKVRALPRSKVVKTVEDFRLKVGPHLLDTLHVGPFVIERPDDPSDPDGKGSDVGAGQASDLMNRVDQGCQGVWRV